MTGSGKEAASLRLSAESAARIRNEIGRAGGREVFFLGRLDSQRRVVEVKAVSRGNRAAVLAAARDAEEGGLALHNHPSGNLEPSDADLATAARLYDVGLGTAIVDNEARSLFVVVEPPEPRHLTLLDLEHLDRILAPEGILSRLHPGYEDRPEQRRMLRFVAQRYNRSEVGLVEAGTGTGKSLAYLLPAAIWARENGERTVVSTNTINLQEQLVRQDLPLVERLVGGDLRWALVKGRSNYVSIRRARLAAASAPSLFDGDRSSEMEALLEWIDASDDGSRSDLPFAPTAEIWGEVESDSDICLRARCPHFQACFYQRSRRRAASAEILVVNHHLLFTDLAVRRATNNWSQAAVLPPYRHLILDEAHNLEDAATSHLGTEITRRGLFRTLSRLDRRGKGVLAAIQATLRGEGGSGELVRRVEERVRPAVKATRSGVELLLEALGPLLPDPGHGAVRIGPEGIPEPRERSEVQGALERLLASLARLEREVAVLRDRVEADGERAELLEGRILDLRGAERRLGGAAAGLRRVLDPEEETTGDVRWLEVRRSGRARRETPVFAAAPIDLGPLLREALFRPLDTVVLSSATLATRDGFSFVRRRLGLEAPEEKEDGRSGLLRDPTIPEEDPLEVRETLLESPFDFQAQTFFGVPTDLPGPGSRGDAFEEATARVLHSTAEVTGGGIFALFTSHRALRRSAELLRERGAEGRWPLFVHGERPRSRLLGEFVESGRGVLLGTASFWEGVDVPGRPLRALVIQKLPFRVPTEPVTAARLEALEEKGRNPFWSYMLPLAALRLKQGFGRLVRSRSDRGAILLLDDRILTRSYGRYLRDSLPPAPLVKGPWRRIEEALSEFYGTDPVRSHVGDA